MKNKISLFSLLGLLFGIIIGIIIPQFFEHVSFIGIIYVNLLKFIIVPILLTNIIVTIYNTRKDSIHIIVKTISVFIVMFVSTFLITSLILMLLKPGNNYSFLEVAWNQDISPLNIIQIIINLFPSNMVTMISNNSIFTILLFSCIFGISAIKVEKGNKIIEVIDGFKEIFNKILEIIMYLTPFAVFSLVGTTIAEYGSVLLGAGIKYILLSYFCGLISMMLIMILPVWFFAKINPVSYIKKVYKVWVVSFTTCSSIATLPTTLKICNEEFGIPEKITNIIVPLGCTIHMCGGAVSFALLGIFCCQMFGMEISFTTFLMMLSSSVLINMAAPGIPNGGIIIGATYLTLLNVPLTFIGFYGGIYRLLDMNYTTLNVTGDITANVLINKLEERKKK